jgi:signal recognition particle receptor subunit beta
MVRFNNTDRIMSLKVVYVGCALGGKTTSLEKIHERIAAPQRSRLVSLNTANDRTLFFDLLPLDLGQINGYGVSLQLFTVPGQVQYTSTRRAVLTGADAIVVVVDSSRDRLRDNREAIHELTDHLKFHGMNILSVPLVLQYNKRDLAGAMAVEELNHELNPRDWPWFESVATEGKGVVEPFLKSAVSMADEIVGRYKFPPSFGERLASSLERLLEAPGTPARPIPEEPVLQTLPETEAAPEPEPEEPLAPPPPPEPLAMEEQQQFSSLESLRTLQESLSKTGTETAGGGRQRIQSSIDSSEAVDLQLLLQGAIEAHESMAKLASELDKAKEKLKMREGHIAELGRICRWCLGQQPLQETFNTVLRSLIKALQAAGGAILLPETGSRALREHALEGFPSDPINTLPCKGFPSLAAGLYNRACPSVSPDPSGTVNPVDRHLLRWGIVSHIASPLESQGQLLGLMTSYRVEPFPPFDKADIAFFSAAVALISGAIELGRLRSAARATYGSSSVAGSVRR